MKIYFAGAIRGGRDDKEWYRELVGELRAYGTVLTEHIGDVALGADGERNKTAEEIYARDMEWLASADAVVADVSTPSLGVGYELRFAEGRGIPALCLFRQQADRRLSAMIVGSHYFEKNIHTYAEGDRGSVSAALKAFFARLG